jgi:hypothetical protein
MTAVPILLANEVASVINTAAAADQFAIADIVARRSYPDWDDEYTDLKDLSVDVVFTASNSGAIELDSESSLGSQPTIDVAVRKRFLQADRDEATGRLRNESVDPLVRLVEQIHELVAAERGTPIELGDSISASWMESNVVSWVNQRMLREGLFEGVVRIRFNVNKPEVT